MHGYRGRGIFPPRDLPDLGEKFPTEPGTRGWTGIEGYAPEDKGGVWRVDWSPGPEGGEMPISPDDAGLTPKDTNPKDAVGIRKWRQFTTIPLTVMAELGVAMLEGARKYGKHNYRVAGVRASVYVDAAMGHIMQWWEGEDYDRDSGLSHIVKAIASMTVLRDAMIQGKLVDDRPPRAELDRVRADLQDVVDEMFGRYPDPKQAYTEEKL